MLEKPYQLSDECNQLEKRSQMTLKRSPHLPIPVLCVGADWPGFGRGGPSRYGYAGAVTVIEAAGEIPCDRPPLSKEFLLGLGVGICGSSARRPRRLDVKVRLARDHPLDANARTVTLSTGRPLRFDGLLIATGPGATARAIPGSLETHTYLRD